MVRVKRGEIHRPGTYWYIPRNTSGGINESLFSRNDSVFKRFMAENAPTGSLYKIAK